MPKWVESYTIFSSVLASRINLWNLKQSNWCHTWYVVQTQLPWVITFSDPWLTFCTGDTSTTIWWWKFQWKNSLLKGQEMVSAWDQRIGRKVASDGATWWLLQWMLVCFCSNLKNKANKVPKYSKTLDLPNT